MPSFLLKCLNDPFQGLWIGVFVDVDVLGGACVLKHLVKMILGTSVHKMPSFPTSQLTITFSSFSNSVFLMWIVQGYEKRSWAPTSKLKYSVADKDGSMNNKIPFQ